MTLLSTVVALALGANTALAAPPQEAALLDKAYAAIAAGNDLAARTYLLQAGTAAPADALPRKELFYVDLRLKRVDEAFGQARKADELGTRDDAFHLDVAYALLDAGRGAEGDALLRSLTSSADAKVAAAAAAQLAADSAVTATPSDLQAAYAADARGDHAAALAAFDTYLARSPGDDAARLQRDYELLALGRTAEADKELTTLSRSSDATVAAQAREQLAADRGSARGGIYSYYQREGRFGGSFYGSDAIAPLGAGVVQPYVALHVANDVGSGGALRQTLTDRAAAIDAGVRTPIGNGGWAFAEAGEGFGLAGQGNIADARYGYEFDRDWGAADTALPHTSFGESAAVYSRYAGNAIGYAQLTHDFALVGPFRGILQADAAADTRRLYFNNTAEIGAGISVGTPSFSVRFLTVRGIYLPRGADRPGPASFGTSRVQLLFGISL
jgi:hypothetical protein